MEDNLQSIYNFDAAELIMVYSFKADFVEHLTKWELEKAYWKLRDLRREIDAKFSRGSKIKIEIEGKDKNAKTEKEIMDDKMKSIDNKFNEYKSKRVPSEQDKANFYLILEEFYMELCYTMKKHGIYFREGEDNTFAVLKR